MRHARTLLFMLCLGGPGTSAAQSDDDLSRFLGQRVPAGTMAHARALRFFEPYKLVVYVRMDPTAGPPGIVLEDIRLAWNPATKRLRRIDLAWMATYRVEHPLDVMALSDAELTAYLGELVTMIPGANRWGFQVLKLQRRGRRVGVSFRTPHQMGFEGAVWEHTVRFTETGAVEVWKHLER